MGMGVGSSRLISITRKRSEAHTEKKEKYAYQPKLSNWFDFNEKQAACIRVALRDNGF